MKLNDGCFDLLSVMVLHNVPNLTNVQQNSFCRLLNLDLKVKELMGEYLMYLKAFGCASTGSSVELSSMAPIRGWKSSPLALTAKQSAILVSWCVPLVLLLGC